MTVAAPRPTTLDEALARLDEAQDALRAIGAGEVDAFVVPDGDREPSVFGLSTVDRPYRTFFENMPDGAATVSADGTVLYANDRLAELLDVPKSMIVGARLSSFVAGDVADDWHQVYDGTAAVELDVARACGPSVPVLVGMSPLDVDGERFTCVTFTDMRAQRADEAEIRFQAQLLDTAGQAIVAVDTDGIALYWNKHAEQMYGWTAGEALGRSVLDMLLPSPEIAERDELSAMVRAGQTWGSDTWVKRRDGTLFPVFATSTPVTDDDGRLVAMITVATDITERKAAEERTQRLSAIVESSSDAIIGMTLDRVITSWNPGAVALFGYQPEEAIGHNISMLASPTVHGHVLTASDPPAGLSLSNVEVQCITNRRALLHVSLSISPILDEHGRPQGLSGIARSVAERIAFESAAEQSRKRLVTAQHKAELDAIAREEANRANQAKSEFLSRMSHELRTPLNAMLGFGQILSMDELTEDQRESVGYIVSAGEHLLRLINDVLDISRIEAGAMQLSLERVHLDEVVAEAIALIRPQAMQSDISLSSGPGDGDEIYVQSDRQRLLQVLLNLLSNAIKYNRPEGRVDLICGSIDGRVSIAVSDTGVGMSERDLAKLFTPFERLGADRMGVEGTGVGLAVSRVLSEEMGGSLTVTSTLGTGSTFTLELPTGQLSATVEHPPEHTSEPVVEVPSVRQVTVLAIEDNVMNTRLLERVMVNCENSLLLTAIQGRIGLELATQHHPDLVLLDLNLPDLSGEEVLERLKAGTETAAIPVVICSGDASDSHRRACLEAGAAAYLTKPFDLDELYRLVEQARRGEPVEPAAEPTG